MFRRYRRLFLVGAIMAAVLSPALESHATPGGWAWSGDYATEELGDPWDFSNDADWDVQARAESANISNAGISNGTLKFNASAQGYVLIGSAHYGSAALQWGSSSWLRPIVAADYSTVVLRMYSSMPTGATAGLNFYTCGETVAGCDNNIGFNTTNGWQTYSFPVSANPGWTGNIYGLRITPTAFGSGAFEIDYIRVLRNGGSASPVVEPIPTVLDPDRAGGTDYAVSVRGNAWDFNGPDDVAAFANISNVSFGNGAMHACNTNNDPGFILPIAEPIDGSWYNRLSARIHYEGGFSLANAPGGGMNARVLFATAGSNYQISQDIVVYPGWNDIDVELGTNPPWAMLEEGTPGPGWAGQQITEIRFDPHEDPGVRCFSVDDIKLSAVDMAAPGFAVKFRDDAQGIGAPSGGTTAEVWLDTNRGSFGGTRVGNGIAVHGGVNTFNFTGGLPTGFYWVWVRLTDGAGRQSSAYSRAPLLVGPPQPLPGGSTRDVDAGVSGSAALVNLTMTQAQRAGYLTADRCNSVAGLKDSKSNGNYTPGQDIANLSVIPLDSGLFCIYNSAAVHEIADVQGVFSGSGNLSFSEFTPPRFDTRPPAAKPPAGGITEVSTNAPAGTEAVLVNLTMTGAEAPGYITADRCSTLRADQNADKQFSNGNYVVGQDIANLAVVRIDGDGKFCIFTKTRVNLIADVQGRFAPSGSMKFGVAATARFDTRGGPKPVPQSTTRVTTGLPAGTPYALVNLTTTVSDGRGYITAERDCATATSVKDSKSNGNFVFGRDVANLSVVPLSGDGSFCIFTDTATHLIVDVQGSFSSSNSLGFALSGPNRRLDTRS